MNRVAGSAQRHEGDVSGGSDVAGASRVSLCQDRLWHCGHFMKEKVRGRPAAFQRIPPSSQIDRAKPHEHRIIHERDSASMLSAHRRGRMRTKNVWRSDMNVERRRTSLLRDASVWTLGLRTGCCRRVHWSSVSPRDHNDRVVLVNSVRHCGLIWISSKRSTNPRISSSV